MSHLVQIFRHSVAKMTRMKKLMVENNLQQSDCIQSVAYCPPVTLAFITTALMEMLITVMGKSHKVATYSIKNIQSGSMVNHGWKIKQRLLSVVTPNQRTISSCHDLNLLPKDFLLSITFNLADYGV